MINLPQPATHYLITRSSIPEHSWADWWDKYKTYFGLGSSAPDLFYFPLTSKNSRADISWKNLANPLHHESSYDMFCTLLDIARQSRVNNDEEAVAEKRFAFAFGYYSHVIADCIFHPYVYRSTSDHWHVPQSVGSWAHKAYELDIDTGICEEFYGEENLSRISWECDGEDYYLLDFCISTAFEKALLTNYPTIFSFNENIASDSNHPIHQAYVALKESTASLFDKNSKIIVIGSNPITKIRTVLSANLFNRPVPNCPTLDGNTPRELFKFSTLVGQEIFIESLNFFKNTEESSSVDYFKNSKNPYLNSSNWNLDTGLPCDYNHHPEMKKDAPEHYCYRAEELNSLFRSFKDLV